MLLGESEGRTLPRFVTDELRAFLTCGIPAHGFAQLYCDTCKVRHIVAFCCKGRGFCPSCGGRRMNEGAANLADHVLPDEVPLRQWVLTLPFPLRFPLAYGARLLGAVLRIFTETVAAWYRKHAAKQCGTANSEYGGLTVIQRASSDLRLNPHFHTLFLDGVYVRDDADANAPPVFHPASPPTQENMQAVVQQAAKRIVRFLQQRGLIALATAPGDGEVTVVVGDAPKPKGRLCAEQWGFNLHAATRVHGNDKQGREHLCRYILRPPFANHRLHTLPDGKVQLDFKRPELYA